MTHDTSAVDEAKAVIASHEQFAKAGNIDGIARGTLTLNDGDTTPLANNFLLVLRRQADGKLRVWRGAFAPSGA